MLLPHGLALTMHVRSAVQASAAVATAVGAAAAAPPGGSEVTAAAAASWVATWPPSGALTVRIGEIFVSPSHLHAVGHAGYTLNSQYW